ncbi:Alpha-amylase/subtilisin inhibitor [Heracleum sosnowskyi]|uniref:Alpha-amylase/subtilisin inhibitor n=1 Tax=Heracleum sosnowskyi TaxID=360622 RepID=A0AAD8IS66_9APIA|nr:Alpha-amylase/subtilisin inhibitor [Heracleum sosnowskyi]
MYTRCFFLSYLKLSAAAFLCIIVLLSHGIILCQSLDPGDFQAVLDVDGQELQSDAKYYILPAVRVGGNGGGLGLSSRGGACPFTVMQESHEQSNGLPVRFLPVNYKMDANISLSSDINIVFHAATICVQSTGWKVAGVDEITGRRYVKSGGLTGHPGVNTVSNWFKVEKNENGDGYKIVFCPSVCSFCKLVCGNVGVFDENGKKWLGLSDGDPLIVTFRLVG